VTASDIHKKMQQLCSEHAVCAPIRVLQLAELLRTDVDTISLHIESLATLGLVEYQDGDKKVVLLTTSGKLARLP
jgi:hypothetical protein